MQELTTRFTSTKYATGVMCNLLVCIVHSSLSPLHTSAVFVLLPDFKSNWNNLKFELLCHLRPPLYEIIDMTKRSFNEMTTADVNAIGETVSRESTPKKANQSRSLVSGMPVSRLQER